jgi:hypothetical protein
MAQCFEEITPDLADWIRQQRIFFVATAPLAAEGLINCSPKGLDTLRIVGPKEVAYLDLTGSGVETIAHVRENGRIVLMLCALAGPPRIVRLHGTGQIVSLQAPGSEELAKLFPGLPGARSVIRVRLKRISDSCGFGVPRYEYVGERDAMTKWAESQRPDGLARYRFAKNACSVDGLPAWTSQDQPTPPAPPADPDGHG